MEGNKVPEEYKGMLDDIINSINKSEKASKKLKKDKK